MLESSCVTELFIIFEAHITRSQPSSPTIGTRPPDWEILFYSIYIYIYIYNYCD
jgi:hypothetical protein